MKEQYKGSAIQLNGPILVKDDETDREVEQSEMQSNGQSADLQTSRTQSEVSSPASEHVQPLKFDALLKGTVLDEHAVSKNRLAIVVPQVRNPWEYVEYEEPSVTQIIEALEDLDGVTYSVQFSDGQEDTISLDDLLTFPGGPSAFEIFDKQIDDSFRARSSRTHSLRGRRRSQRALVDDSDVLTDETLSDNSRRRTRASSKRLRITRSLWGRMSLSSDVSTDSDPKKKRLRVFRPLSKRSAAKKSINYSDVAALEVSSDDSEETSGSDRPRKSNKKPTTRRGRPLLRGPKRASSETSDERDYRRSERVMSIKNMQEVDEDDIPEQVTVGGAAKYFGAKEHFQQLPSNDDFRLRHCQSCETCSEYGNSNEKGRLVYCQSCTFSYHQKCLGTRNSRDHLVTKIGDRNFVLQCKRCITLAKHKDQNAPDQAKCFTCATPSPIARPLRERKTTREEHKEREENNGEDPITEVSLDQINNPQNVLFRCFHCYRACHFHHLPPRDGRFTISDLSIEHIADDRFAQYCKNWACKDCTDAPAGIDALIAWRPTRPETYQPGTPFDQLTEDDKEYLIKWKKLSYFDVSWMPGAWTWGTTTPAMRKAFIRREHNAQPKMQTEDAVPEDMLRIDIIFEIQYTNVVNVHTIKVDQARIKEVEKALVKFKGLGYEDVVWVKPPQIQDSERWADFKLAYDDWVMGLHIHPPLPSTLGTTLSRLRAKDFATKVKLLKQPESLKSGTLMDYQLEGVNWIYYQWFRKQNVILADEMGLGKTIQIIGFLVTLTQLHNCYPFLVVVPNSTCPNWRRETKQWAPDLRVVTYYGSAESRKLAQKHELFPGEAKDLRCHVVVTSYEAAQDDEFKKVFRGVHWAGLVVDEGQRLKNDKNILFGALSALKIPFKILLTGTPLQNNARELFNLLQFLDNTISAKVLEEEYAELTQENVPRLHQMLRPFMLRRTKAEVLSFLPPMAQIIVPVSLTNVQRKLYRSILAKNPELIKSVFGAGKIKQTERATLNNILMQLRKCLCHPFVYSRAIEQVSNNPLDAHRNLVEASSKLRLLEIMLPKLQERGHRVLIFSQFLDMLDIIEDFLDGLGLYYQRLDGTIGALQKQKRIDEFNAPDSPLFAFLLSTRAGGVGINLATADTVIILDPDFNPHQDIQALSRAHRIGQKNKVLVFQITTRGTAEEKIMQVGKKKMALDHVLIEHFDAEEDGGLDLESILRHGTDAIFKDDDPEDDIRYDAVSVDKLLDRSQIEDTLPGKDNSVESQFSFARVWVNDRGVLEEEGIDSRSDHDPDPSVWDAILREREREAAEEAAAKAEALGRGRRKRQNIDYTKQIDAGASPGTDSDSDTDYQVPAIDSDVEMDLGEEETHIPEGELPVPQVQGSQSTMTSPPNKFIPSFSRVKIPSIVTQPGKAKSRAVEVCVACDAVHRPGHCPLKLAGVEDCGLCGLAHYGVTRACPHMGSRTQLKSMIEAIKKSSYPNEIKDLAKKQVVGMLGYLNQRRRHRHELKRQNNPQAASNRSAIARGGDGTYDHGENYDGVWHDRTNRENQTAPHVSYTQPFPATTGPFRPTT